MERCLIEKKSHNNVCVASVSAFAVLGLAAAFTTDTIQAQTEPETTGIHNW
jgi:hypothetical protein